MEAVMGEWQEKYLSAMKKRNSNRDAICPIFKFWADVYKAYIQLMQLRYLKYILLYKCPKECFPERILFHKTLYLDDFETSKADCSFKKLGLVYSELSAMHKVGDCSNNCKALKECLIQGVL